MISRTRLIEIINEHGEGLINPDHVELDQEAVGKLADAILNAPDPAKGGVE